MACNFPVPGPPWLLCHPLEAMGSWCKLEWKSGAWPNAQLIKIWGAQRRLKALNLFCSPSPPELPLCGWVTHLNSSESHMTIIPVALKKKVIFTVYLQGSIWETGCSLQELCLSKQMGWSRCSPCSARLACIYITPLNPNKGPS